MATTPTNDRPPFRQAIQTTQIIQILQTFTPGQEIGRAELCQRIGCTLGEMDRTSWLPTACKRLRKDDHKVFASHRRMIRRLTSDEIRQEGDAKLAYAHRAAGRQMSKLEAIVVDELTPDERLKFCATATLWGLLQSVTTPTAVKRLVDKVASTQQKLPLDATLGVFLGQPKKEN